jgi:hypothetical protein
MVAITQPTSENKVLRVAFPVSLLSRTRAKKADVLTKPFYAELITTFSHSEGSIQRDTDIFTTTQSCSIAIE